MYVSILRVLKGRFLKPVAMYMYILMSAMRLEFLYLIHLYELPHVSEHEQCTSGLILFLPALTACPVS